MRAGVTGAVRAESAKPAVEIALLVELQFDLGTEYLWTGSWDLSWNGQTWIGAGTLLSFAPLPETMEVQATKLDIALSGLDSSILTPALTVHYQGRLANVYFAFISGLGVINSPVKVGSYLMDQMSIVEGADDEEGGVVLSLSLESRLARLDQSSPRRLTQEDQLLDFPGDLGLEFVSTVHVVDKGFGRANTSGGSTTGGQGGGGTRPSI